MNVSHAGFATTITLRVELAQDVVRTFYHGGVINHRLTAHVPDPSSGRTYSFDVFLDLPRIAMRAEDDDRVLVNLSGWGTLTVTEDDGTSESRDVMFVGRLLASPHFTINGAELGMQLDWTTATLPYFVIGLTSPFSDPGVDQLVRSDVFRIAAQTGLQSYLPGIPVGSVTLSMLGAPAAGSTSVTYRVLDDCLVLGVDVVSGPIITAGNRDLLTDDSAGLDIGVWLNPVVLPMATATVRQSVDDAVAGAGGDLRSFSMGLDEGAFRIAGSAEASEGTVSFSLRAVPQLGRAFPSSDEIWFDIEDLHVSLDRDWWVWLIEAVVGVFTLGIGVIIAESIITMIRHNIAAAIYTQEQSSYGQRDSRFTLPGTTEPFFHLRLERYECHSQGVFQGFLLRSTLREGSLQPGPFVVTPTTFHSPAQFTLPFDLHPDDPILYLDWEFRAVRSDLTLVGVDGLVGRLNSNRRTRTLQLWSPSFLERAGAEREFVFVYHLRRDWGPFSETLWADSRPFFLDDRLNRRLPYVSWEHWMRVPIQRVESDGTLTRTGSRREKRTSAIHRTDLAGRCRFADRYSVNATLTYLPELPFPADEIIPRRDALCDYCFFGGPTKTVPLV